MENKETFSTKLKWITINIFLTAIIFFMFFSICKHSTLNKINAFGEDPFDAVGSFGVQLALFASLVSLIRFFTPFTANKAFESRELLILRANVVSLLAVLVTLIADIIAMIRFRGLWIGSQDGMLLAAMLGGMMILTIPTLWKVFSMVKETKAKSTQSSWHKTAFVWLVSIVVLALYPESWRSGFWGAIYTAATGMALLFVMVSSFIKGLSFSVDMKYEDLFEDLYAIYQFLKGSFGFASKPVTSIDKPKEKTFIKIIVDKFNPRKHIWNFNILIAFLLGIAVLLIEVRGEGMPPSMEAMLLMAAAFIGLESSGILLGYFLLGEFLGIFRKE